MQAPLVDALMAEGQLFIPFTVLIETEWVLRAVYALDRETVSRLLAHLSIIDEIALPDAEGVIWACARHAAGADFADMIHIVASREHDAFVSLERKLATQAGVNTPIPIERLA